ncbi:hypothetical protein BC938DRAFT_476682, partial [Jimgerdemannia flammicorona]
PSLYAIRDAPTKPALFLDSYLSSLKREEKVWWFVVFICAEIAAIEQNKAIAAAQSAAVQQQSTRTAAFGLARPKVTDTVFGMKPGIWQNDYEIRAMSLAYWLWLNNFNNSNNRQWWLRPLVGKILSQKQAVASLQNLKQLGQLAAALTPGPYLCVGDLWGKTSGNGLVAERFEALRTVAVVIHALVVEKPLPVVVQFAKQKALLSLLWVTQPVTPGAPEKGQRSSLGS